MLTVCLATYNGQKYIKEQLDSILSQLGSEDEMIVSDDNSTDATLDIVRSYADSRITVIQGPCLYSPALNFENALRHAHGDIIILSDQDDVWESDKVECVKRALQNCLCVVSDCYVTDEEMQVMSRSFYELSRTRSGRFYNLLIKNGYLGCCMAFRRQLLDTALPFPKNVPMHDIWLGNVAAFTGGVQFIPQRLIRYRRHGHNSSPTAHANPNSLLRRLGFRLRILFPLLRRVLLR